MMSCNDRLGSIAEHLGARAAGVDVIPMTTFFLDEILALAEHKGRKIQEAAEEARTR